MIFFTFLFLGEFLVFALVVAGKITTFGAYCFPMYLNPELGYWGLVYHIHQGPRSLLTHCCRYALVFAQSSILALAAFKQGISRMGWQRTPMVSTLLRDGAASFLAMIGSLKTFFPLFAGCDSYATAVLMMSSLYVQNISHVEY